MTSEDHRDDIVPTGVMYYKYTFAFSDSSL